ncbi:TonB-dependent receptor domain-containing protein [Sphingomonas xanthus]|uniref:TonB-dependent receptor n=1 Tax=Sphingomonas xanthus TaxID=2594473 RepID=A0A516IP95_9SPHN|nr:TonB-dependent receptor [Sphingomonas xanthus]QDP18740.1 TonB-dependent receptor [Sphingomonas xanthus]
MNRRSFTALAGVSFFALAAAAPAYGQTPDTVLPNEDACQAPAGQVDKDACPDVAEQQSSAGAEAGSSSEAIVVVGSRIPRNEFNTADNIKVLTRSESTQAGFVSTAEVLQSTAVTGGTSQINDSYGGFVVNGGPGVNTISLRGLGATRTLVLMNGRRVTPSGSRGAVGSADLNTLPSIIVDRVEILNTGASSIYGSDAVAGVVNIVTRSKFQGVQIEAQHNIPEVGAGSAYRYGVIAGKQFGRLDLLGSFEYYKRDSLAVGDRDFASCPTGRYGTNGDDFGAGDFINPRTGEPQCFPLENGGVTVNTIATRSITWDGTNYVLAPGVQELAPTGTAFYQCNRFRPLAGAPGTVVPGYECVGGNYFSSTGAFLGGMSLNLRDTQSSDALERDIISGAKTYTGYVQAILDTDILGNAKFYANMLGTRRDSEQDGTRQLTIDYPRNSPLIPAELQGAAPVNSSIGIRVFGDYGLYNNRQTVDFYRLNGGMMGDLPFNWNYDLFAGHSWSKAKYTTDLVLTDRINNTLNVVPDGSGGYLCANVAARDQGCVAAPALSADVVGGNFKDNPWFDYIVEPVTGTTKYKESTLNLTVNGPLFELPAGKIQAALGVEYRKAEIDDTPDVNSQNNNLYGFTSSSITRGKDSVWEAFGEIEVPILRQQFFHALTVNGSARYTEYKSYGGDWTYKVGGLFSPVRAVSLRGSYGTSYRAPALFEQFLGATTGFLNSSTDPCANLNAVTNPLVRDRCLAEGLPPTFQQNNSVTVIGVGGADAGLKAETSKALTYGIVVQPPLGDFADVSLSVDYFDVRVENGISRLSASQVLSQCYSSPERTLCDTPFIVRQPYTGPGTGALQVTTSYINISDARVKGLDFNARFVKDLGPGRFSFDAAMTRFKQRYSRTLPTDDILNVIGLISNPKWTGTFDANYKMNKFNFHYGVEWVGKTDAQDYAEPFGFNPNRYDLKTPDYFLHNASIRYDDRRFGLTLGVRNLFDRDPPVISADYTNLVGNAPLYSGYDYRGRTFFLNVRAGFGTR